MILSGTSRRCETAQINPRIAKEVVQDLKREARHRKTPESFIVEAALKTFLSQTDHEAAIDRRLNKLQNQLEMMRREQQILLETLATFVKVYLAHTPEIPVEQKQQSEENGLVRFERFLGIIAKAFENEVLFREVVNERILTAKDFQKPVA